MTGLLVACVLISGNGHARHLRSVLGEWCAWRITSGDVLVDPPQLAAGKLVLKFDGTFTWHLGESSCAQDSHGRYRLRCNLITLKGKTVTTEIDGEKTPAPMELRLARRDGQLWDGAYCFGCGSLIYARPGKKPEIPLSECDWPSLSAFWPGR